MNPQVAVVGTGANGGAIAADFIRSGVDVTLIDPWPENVRAIRANGLRVLLPEEEFVVDADVYDIAQVATLRRRFDIVLVLVKAYDTDWAVRLIAPLLHRDSLVVGAQNGMTHGVIADAVGASRAVGCVIEVGGSMFVPGVVERDTRRDDSWFAVGGVDRDSHSRAEAVAELLRTTGRVELTDDIGSAKWMKLVVNAAELVPSAIPDMTLAGAASDPLIQPIMLRAGVEALELSSALGYVPRPIFGHPADPSRPVEFIGELLEVIAFQYAKPTSYTTVLQDWHKGRRSEAEDINGLVVEEARRLGRRAPVNDVIARLARRIESGEIARGAEAAALLAAEMCGLAG